MKRRTYLALFLTLMLIEGIVVFNATIFSNSANAEVFEAEQGLSFTLNSSVAVSITGGTGSGSDGLTIEDLVPGDYKDSNIITVTASSNSASGYTLSSSVGSSSSNYTDLRKTPSDSTNKFTNLSGNKASLSSFDPGYWGYSYSTNGGTSWISGDIVSGTSAGYNGLPIYTTTTPIKLINSSTASSSSIQFKIGAKATSSQVSGAYTNIINFIGVGKVITTNYTINYNTNGGSTIADQTGTTNNGAVQIPATNVPTKQNNIFKGWCTIDNSSDPTTCTGTGAEIIQPGNFLPLNTTASSTTKTLYAVWEYNAAKTVTFDDAFAAAGKTKQGNYYKMQDGTSSICASVTKGQIGQLIDIRDNETYYVGKLADGKCWMLDNLRLDLTNSTILNGLTTSNTNVDSASLTSLKSGNRSAGNQYASSGFVKWDSSSFSNAYNQAKANAAYKDTTTTSYGAGSGKIGVYYNYCAASAGSYCYDANKSTGNASYDLCPAGWRMPTGGDSGEYQALYTAYSSDATSFLNALSTPLSGYFNSGTSDVRGTYGYFWSSAYCDAYNMYRLFVSSSSVYPSSNRIDRGYGNSVRCLLSS